MKLIKNLIVLLIVLIVFGYGILFAIYNQHQVMLDFLFHDPIKTPLSLWSGILVSAGVIIGLLVSALSKLNTNMENKRLKKELKQVKGKLEKIQH